MKKSQKLPIGIQDFSELRNGNYIYIDKTEQIYDLLESKFYFLSRPRRFGKSLLCSTLKEIFSGNQELFKGLWIENKIEWKKFPVIHLSFGKSNFKELGLRKSIFFKLNNVALENEIILEQENISDKFEELIKKLYTKYNEKVVILIDEYDKPMIDFLGKDEIHIALENQQIMKEFYSPIKDADKYLRFLLITGISKFSKVSIFSELNHLEDISLSSEFGTMLGYTEKEILENFEIEIENISKKNDLSTLETIEKMRSWYNGYNFRGDSKVYNPFSVLNFFKKKSFENFWFETGTPTFLVKLMQEQNFYDVDNTEIDLLSLGSFKIDNIEPIVVLFQAGYLTLGSHIEDDIYVLSYPNKEVKNSMLRMLLAEFAYVSDTTTKPLVAKIKRSLESKNIEEVILYLNSLFAKIPYQIFEKHLESYYHSIIFLTFTLLGYYTKAEVSTSKGRIDAVVTTKNDIFIFEFKVDESAEIALKQIKEKKYYEKYLIDNKPIYLIGVCCQNKEIAHYVVELYED